MKSLSEVYACTTSLVNNRDGNFGVMTALVAMVLVLAAGGAMDYTKATAERENLQALADSAVLAGQRLYDGTNGQKAIDSAKAFLTRYSGTLSETASFDVKLAGDTLQVSFKTSSDNAFMDMAGFDKTPIGVTANALAPMMPKSINFTPTKAQGWYYKKVSIVVVRPKSTVEETIGTVEYQPTTQVDGGSGTMVVMPVGVLDLGEYTKLVLQMDIKNDGCPIGKTAKVTNSIVTCNTSSRAVDQKYDLVLRTDNTSTSHYLFVEGKQLPQGVKSPLEDILECGKTVNHAWEDGGGFARQDFFYTATSICAPNGQFVRLTR